VSLLPPSARLVGTRVARTEDARLLTGRGRYVDDVSVSGLLAVAFARSDLARARLARLDVSSARCAEGVIAVLTAAELNPRLAGRMAATVVLDAVAAGPERVLADGDVRYVGEPYAVVIATTRALAEDAAELIEVEMDPRPPVIDYEAAIASDQLVHPDETASNLAREFVLPPDDEMQIRVREAAHFVEATYVQNRYLAVPMETRGVVAWWDPRAELFDVWVSTQSPHDVRTVTSRITGVPEGRIRVRAGDVGGGFGQKAYLARDEQVVILASYHLGRPLKWIEDRRENLVAATSSRADRCTVTAAADADGHLVGMTLDHLDDVGAFPLVPSAGMMAAVIFTGPYRVPKFALTSRSAYTNTCPRAPYRGPWQFESYAREQIIDRLARRIGLDPLELRRRNVLHREDLPYPLPLGLPLVDVSPAETLDQAAQLIGYGDFRLWQKSELAAGRLVGIGIGLYIEPQATAGVYAAEPVHIRVQPGGGVDVYLGSGSHGQGIETTTAQLVSDHLGVAFDAVTVHQGDTSETPYAFGTGGSRSGPILGAAVQQASLGLRDKVIEIAAHLLEAAPDDLDVAEGVVAVKGTPSRSRTLADIAHVAYRDLAALPPGMEPGLEILRRFKADRPFAFSNACHMCTVAIDRGTGGVGVLRYVVSEDCGVMINPAIVEGQIAGGVAQGLGGALLEDFVYDQDGNPLTTTFLDYLIPTAAEVPAIEYGHIETPASTPGHFKGVGEGGAIGAPPAIANAVNDALAQVGAEVTTGPFAPARILEALERAGAAVERRLRRGHLGAQRGPE
jgi:aerobic carbon-monoxide dehydrogenase large subunit